MADTFTPSLNLCKPEINQSAQTWGIKLNSDLDLIDAHAAAMKSFQAGSNAQVQAMINASIAAAIPRGVVVAWIGGAGNIPAGWLLCNGANGTPNLADRFILGNVGNRANWEVGGSFNSGNAVTDVQGWHGHGGAVGVHALTVNEMPVHNHAAWTDTQGDHNHTATLGWGYMNNAGGANLPAGTVPGTGNTMTTNVAGAHGHNVGVGNAGASWGHDHPLTINGDGNHQHNVNVSVVPPYFSLAYIMRA
jgi:hypothetical protein